MELPWSCELDSPLEALVEPLDGLLDELSFEELVDELDEFDELSSDEVPVAPPVEFDPALEVSAAECAIPTMNATVTVTPAATAVPPATAARLRSREGLGFVSMQNTI